MNPHATAHATNRLARRSTALLALALLAFTASACNKLKARDLLNKGVASFKGGQYDDAVEKFKQAKDLDPDLTTARLYLATAYASQYRSEEHTSELQSQSNLVCRLLLEKKKKLTTS